jgi:hypothetical protein
MNRSAAPAWALLLGGLCLLVGAKPGPAEPKPAPVKPPAARDFATPGGVGPTDVVLGLRRPADAGALEGWLNGRVVRLLAK